MKQHQTKKENKMKKSRDLLSWREGNHAFKITITPFEVGSHNPFTNVHHTGIELTEIPKDPPIGNQIICPRETYGKKCPICNLIAKQN